MDARMKVLHEKPDGTKLVRITSADGSSTYGVLQGDDIVFAGTKAEAKRRYGTWRRDARISPAETGGEEGEKE